MFMCNVTLQQIWIGKGEEKMGKRWMKGWGNEPFKHKVNYNIERKHN